MSFPNVIEHCFINGVQYKCRTCFDPGSQVFSLMEQCSDNKTWQDFLTEVAQLKTNDEEVLPKTICCKCLNKLINYYDFLLQIQSVSKQYSELLANLKLPQQDNVPKNVENFTEFFQDPATVVPMEQCVTEIKIEEEEFVPVDIAAFGNDMENKGNMDPLENAEEFIDKKSVTSITQAEEDSTPRRDFQKEIEAEFSKIEYIDKRFVCPICRKTFAEKRNCHRHIKRVHLTENKLFECGFCGARPSCKEYLRAHIRHCHPGESIETSKLKRIYRFGKPIYSKPAKWRLVQCKLCNRSFATAKELRQHLPSHSDSSSLDNLDLESSIVQRWFPNMDLFSVKEAICKNICEKNWFRYYTVVNEFSFELSISDTEVEDLEDDNAAARLSKYVCELCQKGFSFKYEMYAHCKTEHLSQESPYKCHYCELEFLALNMYEQHSAVHCKNEYKVLQCSECPGKFVSEENLKNHHCEQKRKIEVASNTTHAFKCRYCEMPFKMKSDLIQHQETHDKERPYNCTICGKAFKLSSSLKHHLRIHKNKFSFKCDLCDAAFLSPGMLKHHLEGHGDIKCNICGKKYFHTRDLRLHRKNSNHTEKIREKNLCTICGKYLSGNTSLNIHIKSHLEDRPFKCDVCDKGFVTRYKQDLHRRSHFKDRPYKCTQCTKSFTSGQKLKIHMFQHTGERPYVCSICQKGFTKKEYLNLHMLNHTGEKPFRCGVCDQQFKCKSYLKKHKAKSGHNDESD